MSWLTRLVVLGVCAFLVHWSQGLLGQSRELGGERRGDPLIAPPDLIGHMSLGYHMSLADSLWLRALQDFGFCGQDKKQGEDSEGQPRCEEGWSFQMLDAATNLDPRFWMVYRTGAVFLSVVVDDIRGASRLFEKGLEHYPEDWPLLYRAAYHQMAEENNLELAADLFHRAALHGAPDWVPLLAARLFSDIGQIEIGLATLKDFFGELPLSEWPERAQERWIDLSEQLRDLRDSQQPEYF